MSFVLSVERLIDRWQREKLIDDETASRLRADLEKNSSAFSLGSVLATLGGLLLGAAIIMLVAANWQDMPRIMRIGMVFALIWIGYIGGTWRRLVGDRIWSNALYIIGASAFGASMALVGQMYHLSGDMQTAAMVWCFGVTVAALLLCAPILAAFAAFVGCFYLATTVSDLFSTDVQSPYQWIGPLMFLAGVAAALFTRSRAAAHCWVLFAIAWLVLLYFDTLNETVLQFVALLGLVLLFAEAFAHDALQRLTHFARPLATYGLLLAYIALGLLQFRYGMIYASPMNSFILWSTARLVLVVAALVLCGRRNASLRSFAYAGFSIEVLSLAFETVGTIIGTSGFFLTAGILVLLLAVFVRRMERRFARKNAEEARP
ncbi:DUF2157 domain-containing protein [Daeguia caeni]|uniref:DUF2157 domain-containing protein n=1 Tax=Daeguia caeni TaxID=439612 RepID=A0ABV9H5X5_9HYPH